MRVSARPDARCYGLTDGSFRLLGLSGDEFVLDASGRFKGVIFSDPSRLVRSVTTGEQKATFSYALDRSGKVRIAEARISIDTKQPEKNQIIHYDYDDAGRLASVKRHLAVTRS